MSQEAIIEEIKNGIMNYDPDEVIKSCKKALDSGLDPLKIIEDGIAKALQIIGDGFDKGELFLVHLVSAASAAEAGLKDVLEPEIKKRGLTRKTLGKVVLGTVEGDIHDIGKNIVASLLFSSGFEVVDIGKDVPAKDFVKKVKEIDADMIGASALLSTTMPVQREIIEELKAEGIRDRVRVILGGAPVTADWAEEIGADGYAEDAPGAVEEAKRLMQK